MPTTTHIIDKNLPVFATGDQTISGNKTFINNLEIKGTGIFNALDLSNISDFIFSGTDINLISSNVYVTGDGNIYISGNPVLTGVDLTPYATVTNLNLTGSNLGYSKQNHVIENRSLQLQPLAQNYLLAGRNVYNQFSYNGTFNFFLYLPNSGTQSGDKLYLNMTTPASTSISIYTPQPGPGWSLKYYIPQNTTFKKGLFISDYFGNNPFYPIWTEFNDLMGYVDITDITNANNKINTLSGISVLTDNSTQNISGLKIFNSGISLQQNFSGATAASTFPVHWYLDSTSFSQQAMLIDGDPNRTTLNVPNTNTVWGVNLNIVGINTINNRYGSYNINFTVSRGNAAPPSATVHNPTLISSGTSTTSPFYIDSGFFNSISGVRIDTAGSSIRLYVTPSSANRTRFKAFATINSLSY